LESRLTARSAAFAPQQTDPGGHADAVVIYGIRRGSVRGRRITKNWRSARPWQQLFSWPLKKQTIK
jgi:hypothetical protein